LPARRRASLRRTTSSASRRWTRESDALTRRGRA
jgi:hypothetical protein